MARPVIITCAVTGGGDTTSTSPHVPVTPEAIANEAIAAAAAGAAIVHIHVRDPETGKPSRDIALYREVVQRIRRADHNLVINLTTGAGARFTPDEDDPNRNALLGMAGPEERVAHVVELKPDICSLDVATMNFGAHAFVNIPSHIEYIAKAARAAGVKPELEVFDLGHIALARHIVGHGHFDAPIWMQLCLGVPWGAPATTESMLAMKQALPSGAVWSAFGISRHEFAMVAQAVVLGGHVRVGLEDNLYLGPGQLSPGNAPLVERAARIIQELGDTVATPAQAREIVGLK
jgi:uncharacterized protein (DUF849 family)